MATALTGERLMRMIVDAREKCNVLSETAEGNLKIVDMDSAMDVTFEEHFKYQQLQAEFHAGGMLTPEAAMIVYNALGEAYTDSNGGWAKTTDTATKVMVTKLMGELLDMKIKRMKV